MPMSRSGLMGRTGQILRISLILGEIWGITGPHPYLPIRSYGRGIGNMNLGVGQPRSFGKNATTIYRFAGGR